MKVLVVGAKPGSLGAAVADVLRKEDMGVVTAGISGEEVELDAGISTPFGILSQKLCQLQPRHVVCTVGMNVPQPKDSELFDWWRWHYETNAIAPLRLLDAWMVALRTYVVIRPHYVAISSNSAHIPRTGSAAYCASKAALSMALRVRAREVSKQRRGRPVIYGYEPGLLAGTPMTAQVGGVIAGQSLTRMPARTLDGGIVPAHLAELIVANLGHRGVALAGTMIRYDNDEL